MQIVARNSCIRSDAEELLDAMKDHVKTTAWRSFKESPRCAKSRWSEISKALAKARDGLNIYIDMPLDLFWDVAAFKMQTESCNRKHDEPGVLSSIDDYFGIYEQAHRRGL